MGPGHRVVGALAGAALGYAAGQPFPLVVLGAVVATAASHGWLSPDVDQTAPWRGVGQLPGLGRLAAHRYGLSHWWGLPVIMWWGINLLPEPGQWAATFLLAGWVSHLAADFVFGRLALWPWGWWKVGLGLKTGGRVEQVAQLAAGGVLALVVAAAW